jgi:hypothetical protein
MWINLCGYRLVESPFCTVSEERLVKRSWKERLFTWPWRPWKSTKVVEVSVPDPNYYIVDDQVVGHPVTIAKLMEIVHERDE